MFSHFWQYFTSLQSWNIVEKMKNLWSVTPQSNILVNRRCKLLFWIICKRVWSCCTDSLVPFKWGRRVFFCKRYISFNNKSFLQILGPTCWLKVDLELILMYVRTVVQIRNTKKKKRKDIVGRGEGQEENKGEAIEEELTAKRPADLQQRCKWWHLATRGLIGPLSQIFF